MAQNPQQFVLTQDYAAPSWLNDLAELGKRFPETGPFSENLLKLKADLEAPGAPESICAGISLEFEDWRQKTMPKYTGQQEENDISNEDQVYIDPNEPIRDFNTLIRQTIKHEHEESGIFDETSFLLILRPLLGAHDIQSFYDHGKEMLLNLRDHVQDIKDFYKSESEERWKLTAEQNVEMYGLTGRLLLTNENTTAKACFEKAQGNLFRSHACVFRLKEIFKELPRKSSRGR